MAFMAARMVTACIALLTPAAAMAQEADSAVAQPSSSVAAVIAQRDGSSLGWLTGDWQSGNPEDGVTREHWEPMRGGTKLGLSQSVKGRVARGFEYMRIVRHVEGLVFYGSPSGGASVAFPQTALIERPSEGRYEVIFENRDHDFPKKISYRLAGETGEILIATISGANPRTDSMVWQYHRVTDGN